MEEEESQGRGGQLSFLVWVWSDPSQGGLGCCLGQVGSPRFFYEQTTVGGVQLAVLGLARLLVSVPAEAGFQRLWTCTFALRY